MAGIDKTYTSSWEEYQEVKEWMENHTFTCPNGCKVKMGECVYHWNREDFEEDAEEKPVINTGWVEDYFLIRHCPVGVVQERMKAVYPEDEYNAILTGTSEWDDYEDRVVYGTGFKVVKRPKWKLNRCLWTFRKGKPVYRDFIVEVEKDGMPLRYNKSIDKWIDVFNGELGVQDVVSFKGIGTVRALTRRIRKWKLPKGAVVKAEGRYVETDWWFEII